MSIVPEEQAQQALAAMRAHPLGRAASIIGRAIAGDPAASPCIPYSAATVSLTCWSA